MKSKEEIKVRIEEIRAEKKGLSAVPRCRRNSMIRELYWVIDEED